MKISLVLCLIVLLLALPMAVGAQTPSPTDTPTPAPTATPVVSIPPIVVPAPPFEPSTPLDNIVAWLLFQAGVVMTWAVVVEAVVEQAKTRVFNNIPYLNDPSVKPVRAFVIVLVVIVAAYVTVQQYHYSLFLGAPSGFRVNPILDDLLTTGLLAAIAFLRHDSSVANAISKMLGELTGKAKSNKSHDVVS